jgi:3-isopropylmalate/(R)-2-methylmalate dehydratase small subunit
MDEPAVGKAWVFGDNINTDYIISSKRKRDTIDPQQLVGYLMEDIRPGFGKKISRGDFLVGGKNFGCGSSMEIATVVIKAAGIQAVVVKSAARTFFRNCINGGLLLVEMDTEAITEGDLLSIRQADGLMMVINETKNDRQSVKGNFEILQAIVRAGGLMPFIKDAGGFGPWE